MRFLERAFVAVHRQRDIWEIGLNLSGVLQVFHRAFFEAARLQNIWHRLAASEWVNVCVTVGGVGLPISNASGLLLFPARKEFDDCRQDALR